jgi:hypothetical protein
MDKGNMSHCTGCRNTQVLFKLTEILWDRQFLSDVTGCRKTQVWYYYTSSTVHTKVKPVLSSQSDDQKVTT